MQGVDFLEANGNAVDENHQGDAVDDASGDGKVPPREKSHPAKERSE